MNINISDELLQQYETFLHHRWHSGDVSGYVERLLQDEMRKYLAPGYDRDTLTGCKNRFYIEHDFENALLKCKNTDFHTKYLCLDIDHFKNYLDYFGIQAGEQKLVGLARRLENNYPDRNIYRYGGDEFVVELGDGAVIPLDSSDLALKYAIVDIVVKWSDNQKRNFERETYFYLETGFFAASLTGALIYHIYRSPGVA